MAFVPPFAPQFFLLLGIDFFLGNSIITVILDKEFPNSLPYVLEIGSFIDFAELLAGPGTASGVPSELQFYYSFGFCAIAVMSLLAVNLFLFLKRGSWIPGVVMAVFATFPSALVSLSIAGYFVNQTQVPLPTIPLIPVGWIPTITALAAVMLVVSLAYTVVAQRRRH